MVMMVLCKVWLALLLRDINLTKLKVNNLSLDGEGLLVILDMRGATFKRKRQVKKRAKGQIKSVKNNRIFCL